MNSQFSSTALSLWQQQAAQFLSQGDYSQAARCYEQAIAAEPEVKSYYWQLGLTLLLQGQEVEAQTTWFMAMVEGEPEQVELWNAELLELLHTEAQRQETLTENSTAWAIRQQIKEICPTDINNILHLIQLAIQLETYTGEELAHLGAISLLQNELQVAIDSKLLMQVVRRILYCASLHPSSLDFVEACLSHIQDRTEVSTFLGILMPATVRIAYAQRQPEIAVRFAELGLRLDANNPEVLGHLAGFYQNSGNYEQGIETAKLYYSLLQNLPDKIFANHLITRGLMSAGGYWEEACSIFQRQELLIKSLMEEQQVSLDQARVLRLFCSYFFAPYFQDQPKKNRQVFNQLMQLCQTNAQIYGKEKVERYSQRNFKSQQIRNSNKPLKIGYLSHCLKTHSVGWLARWVFQHHNRDHFQLHAYFLLSEQENDHLHQWYVSQVSQTCSSDNKLEVTERIYQDEIDILIDLDSITLDASCEIVALKPAPVQVTWLGWDASGIPAIDYFIADPYVLPESAQEYYSEKIWRLPQTYIAVDGFEVGVPTVRRDQLDIPGNAVVYLCAQRGFKRHPDTARLQMKIVKEVPNSYFLIKGWADDESIKRFFTQLAEEEGMDCDCLRFLPDVHSEATHRANLGIADVVLDTYPYNGATTTLETLWMGIPLVTRVGQQFAARNSYTMMMNVGVTEGIAWTDEEYIEWGVRLGKDEALRQQVAWKLKASRQTSPLWNAKQFTREMEKAYEQMWARYIDTIC